MYQFIKFDNPIPSCQIFELNFDSKNEKWEFVYAINTPYELTNNSNQEPLIIYEYISDLYLKEVSFVHKESINIKVNNLNEYIDILNLQRQADLDYRKRWIEENPDLAADGPSSITLENRNYSHEELLENDIHFIASILKQNNRIELTAFSAI